MNKKGLLLLCLIAVVIAAGIKFNMFPQLGGGSLYKETKENSYEIQRPDGVTTTYYENGKVHTETNYKNNKTYQTNLIGFILRLFFVYL